MNQPEPPRRQWNPGPILLLGGLHVARLSGYVLLRPGRMRPPPVPAGSSPFAESNDPFAPPSD